jgi:hypothetical protein
VVFAAAGTVTPLAGAAVLAAGPVAAGAGVLLPQAPSSQVILTIRNGIQNRSCFIVRLPFKNYFLLTILRRYRASFSSFEKLVEEVEHV